MPIESFPRISGILFDKDGTLFDFEASWAGILDALLDALAPGPVARREMARAGGYDPEGRRFAPGSPIVAGATSEVAALWAAQRPDLGAARIEKICNATAIELAARPGMLVPAAPDLPGLLDGLAGRGLALGVATHDSEASALRQIELAGVRRHFGFVAGYDSGHAPKPDPAMLRAFAAVAGVAPARVAVVGDSVHDLAMARAAGAALAIGVLTGPAREADLAPHADHVIPSIADLPALLGLDAGARGPATAADRN